MSVHVSARVWDQCQQNGEALLVMLALADHSNDAGECWPSFDRIAEMARVEKRSAIRILKRLEEAGEIEVERGGGRGHTNRYSLPKYARHGTTNSDHGTPIAQETVTGESPLPVVNGDTASPKGETERVTLEPQTVTAVQERVTLVHERVTGGSPEPLEPSKNHQEEPSEENSPRDDQRMFDSLCGVYGTTEAAIVGSARGRMNKAIAEWRAEGVSPEQLDIAVGIYRESFKGRQGERPSRADLDDAIGQARAGHVAESAAIDQVIAEGMAEIEARLEASPRAPADADRLWREVHAGLALRMPAATLKAWVDPVQVAGFDGQTLTLQAPTAAVHSWLTQRLARELDEVAADIAPGVSVVVLAPEAAVVGAAA